ncbi:integrase catalytic domain-containing protein [Trichonephila clavipes]|nr:integrase catalytic domain-containing protein [Trichonephila clavipes]
MIWINPDQRKLQRILWRENMDEPIKMFELSNVTYRTTSALFLATRTLKQLALDEAENFPLGSSVVMSDMYIDDVLTGAKTLLEAKELKIQLINIFAKGGMVLHKWCGNNTELIEVSENYDFSEFIRDKSIGCLLEPQA